PATSKVTLGEFTVPDLRLSWRRGRQSSGIFTAAISRMALPPATFSERDGHISQNANTSAGPPVAGPSGLPRRQYLCCWPAGWSSQGDLCDQPEGRAMSGTTIAYLQKLKTRDLNQPTKLTEPGFVSSVGYPRCHVFKNSASPKLGALRNVFTVLEHRCPDHVE